MEPIKVEIPATLPADLRADLTAILADLGPVSEPPARFNADLAILILAAISATADILATANLLWTWRERAKSRGVVLEKVSIVAGNRRINLTNVDRNALVQLLQDMDS